MIIPLAERSELIVEIGRWVLEQACADRKWMQLQQPAGDPHIGVSVNVSPQQLMRIGFYELVSEVLDATATDARRVTLELTEGMYVEDPDRALVVLGQLKSLGIMIALDDYGTGYASLSHLEQFPIDVVKIARRFVGRLSRQPLGAAVVTSIIDLAHSLRRGVTAGGVETAEQHAQLTELGCDNYQGFYFDRPMSVLDLERRLRTSS